MADNHYLTGQKLRAANTDLAAGRIWEAYLTYTDVLETDAPGHPYAFLNRSIALILLGQPALALYDGWRAILAGQWAEKKADEENGVVGVEGNILGTYIQRYVAMYVHALASKDPWTRACANGEVPGEDGRWLAQPLADLVVRKAFQPMKPADDYPHARWIILCGYYRLAYALFKCGGGALQSALNMINLATEKWCTSNHQQDMFKDLQNHILEYVQVEFEADEAYMRKLHADGIIRLPRDRSMMEDNLFRGLMKSTFTTIPREQYFWDIHSITKDNFEELRPELEKYVQENVPDTHLAAILSSDQHPTVKGKAPQLFLTTDPKEGDQHPVLFVDDKGIFVWSRKNGDDIHCDGCGSLLNIDGDWIPSPHPIFGATEAPPVTETPVEASGSGSGSGSGNTASPLAEASPSAEPDNRPRFETPGSDEELNVLQALRDYAKAKFPEKVAPGVPSSSETQTEVGTGHGPAPDEVRPLDPTPIDGRHAFKGKQPETPQAGDKTQGPDGERKDSIYPQEDDDPAPVCPPSPRPKPRSLPATPPRNKHTPQDSEETIDAEDSGPPSIPELRKAMEEMGCEPESDLRTCLGVRCSVFFCSKECEDKHAASHDSVCDLGLEGTLPTIEQEKYAKIGGWWGGMVPTIPKQRVKNFMLRKILTKLWKDCECRKELTEKEAKEGYEDSAGAIPLQVPWIRLLDGNLNEPTPLPQPDEETGMHFENNLPDGDVSFLFPGYKNGTPAPSAEDLARFKSHKMPFSLDYSVIWPLSVLYNIGGFSTVFDIKRFDGWMLTTIMAKVDAAMRVDHFIRFAKIVDADGMVKETRCIDIPPMVRLHGFQKLQMGTHEPSPDHFNDPKLNAEVELLVGSLHPLANLVRVAQPPEEKPNVRLVERNGEVFAFNWPIGTKLEPGTPLLAHDKTVWPFKLLGDMLEPDESPGIGGRWTSIKPETVARLIRRGYEKSNENDPERSVVDDAGQAVEDLCMEYRHAMVVRQRGGAASNSCKDSMLDSDEADDEADDDDGEFGDFEDGRDAETEPLLPNGVQLHNWPMDMDGTHDAPLLDNQHDQQQNNDDDGSFPWVDINHRGPAPAVQAPPSGYQPLDSDSASDSSSMHATSSDEDYFNDPEMTHFVRSESDLRRINRKLMRSLARGATRRFTMAEESESSTDDKENRGLLSPSEDDNESSADERSDSEGGGVDLPVRSASSMHDSSEGGVDLPSDFESTDEADDELSDGGEGGVELRRGDGSQQQQRRRRRRRNNAVAGRGARAAPGEGNSSQQRRGQNAAAGRGGTAPGTAPGTTGNRSQQQHGTTSTPGTGTGNGNGNGTGIGNGTNERQGRTDSVAGTGDEAGADDKLDVTQLSMYDLGH